MAIEVLLHPEAVEDFHAFDGSVRKTVAKKIDALAENPLLGDPLGNKMGLNLTGFYKLYAARKKYRLVLPKHRMFLPVSRSFRMTIRNGSPVLGSVTSVAFTRSSYSYL